MKADEPFNPSEKSCPPPDGINFRLAEPKDTEALTNLMFERNPKEDREKLQKRTENEIGLTHSDPKYRLYVADLNHEVLGLYRFFHSEGLPKEKLKFPAPTGWYWMGVIIHPQYRRKGIARFLSQNGLNSLKHLGAEDLYSMVASNNLASIRMHQEFGFIEVCRADGFLHISFDGGSGILYHKTLAR